MNLYFQEHPSAVRISRFRPTHRPLWTCIFYYNFHLQIGKVGEKAVKIQDCFPEEEMQNRVLKHINLFLISFSFVFLLVLVLVFLLVFLLVLVLVFLLVFLLILRRRPFRAFFYSIYPLFLLLLAPSLAFLFLLFLLFLFYTG